MKPRGRGEAPNTQAEGDRATASPRTVTTKKTGRTDTGNNQQTRGGGKEEKEPETEKEKHEVNDRTRRRSNSKTITREKTQSKRNQTHK